MTDDHRPEDQHNGRAEEPSPDAHAGSQGARASSPDPRDPAAPSKGNPRDPHTSWEAGGDVRKRMSGVPRDGTGVDLDEEARVTREAAERGVTADRRRIGHSPPETPSTEPPPPVGVGLDAADPAAPVAGGRSEWLVSVTFAMVAVGSILFAIAYFAIDIDNAAYAPALGASLGLALLGFGAGAVLWSKRLMPHEDAVQERHPMTSTSTEQEAAADTFAQGTAATGIVKHGILRRTVLLASPLVALPAVLPLLSLGRYQNKEEALAATPWSEGVHLVNTQGVRIKLGDLAIGGTATVLPEGAVSVHHADAPVLLVRMRPEENIVPADREGFAYEGHVAYSMICTHAGCPVKLYEHQTHHLLCPCHQSTFLVTEHCRPVFGPAARPLPQLPISVDDEGFFVATGDFTSPIGPSYWERG